ncbi:MAG TPA: ABC transporter substrate-binding protein [Streptosporangiaceae bacterium]|jgi:ribose transport system substrate-binding protein|nr:ABC transporter substrate-binding protein [Streptosporangiaceae bacterium]
MSRRYSAQVTGVAAVAAISTLVLAACGSSSPSKSSSSGGSSPLKGKTIEIIVGNASDPFYVTMECGAEQEAAKLGVKLTTAGPTDFTPTLQKPIIDEAEVSKPAALLVAPTDVSKLDPDLQKIASNGTKVIFVDTASSDMSLGLSRISSNNALGGKIAADNLGKLLNGKGAVAVVSMAKGTSTTDARVQGFQQEMQSKYPGIKLLAEQNDVDATPTQATSFIESDITADSSLNGVFAANTVTAQGVAAGLTHASKTGKVKMVSFDAEPPEMQMLSSNVAQVIIAQEPAVEGQDGVIQAVNAIEGKQVTASIPTPLTAITSSNMNEASIKPLVYKSSTAGC